MITTGSIYPFHEYLLLTILNRGRRLLPGDQPAFGIQRFHAYENVITNSVFRSVNFAEVSLFTKKNFNKILKFSDAKNTRKIDAFFSKQKSSETWELEVDEQSENRPSSSDTVIDFVEQSESRPSTSISPAKKTDYSCL